MTESEFRTLALAQSEANYVFGGEVPPNSPTFDNGDCSEWSQWLYARAGVTLVDGAANQYKATVPVVGPLKMGDLFFISGTYKPGISHVGVYIGEGQTAEMRSTLRDWDLSFLAEVQGRTGFSGWRRYPAFSLEPEKVLRYFTQSVDCVSDANVPVVKTLCDKLYVKSVSSGRVVKLHANEDKARNIETWCLGRNLPKPCVCETTKESVGSLNVGMKP